MGLIRLQDVRKQLGDRLVIDGVTLEFHTGERVGLVGPNGAGKTTLFKLITGQLTPDSGGVSVSKGMHVGYLAQEPQVELGRTLHDEILSAFEDVFALEVKMHELSERMSAAPPGPQLDELMRQYDRAAAQFETSGGYSYERRLDEILVGLGFSKSDYTLPMAALSGGQKCRAALAKLLLREADFLLLDEPTNHLDIDACKWLEEFLAAHRGGVVLISHDRYLLDRVATRIVEVGGGTTSSYPGNYSAYMQVKDLRRLTQDRQFDKDKAFIDKEMEFIARHMGSQRTAEARGRRTRLQRRLASGEFVTQRTADQQKVRIDFGDAASAVQTGQDVLEVRRLTKRFGEKSLFADLSLAVRWEQSLGVTGPNGTGKSTLLKIVLGMIEADAGEYRFNARARVGYFAQESTDLSPERTIVQELQSIRPLMLETEARSYAARFLFQGEDPFKRVGSLSGGEQSRVRLMKLILRQPNVLILDEPTNHLDIPSREVLEDALLEFPGPIITVSHDRYFLDRICDRLLVMRDGASREVAGNYSTYAELLDREREQAEARERAAKSAESDRPRAASRKSVVATKANRPRSKYVKASLEDIETQIMQREAMLRGMQERFGDPKVFLDPAELARLQSEFESAKGELAELEAEWQSRLE